VTSSPPDRRPPMAVAMEWVSEIITIAALQVVPLLAGWGLDQLLKTVFVFVSLGAILGLFLSLQRILVIAKRGEKQDQINKTKNRLP
jgi:F0F1-type ATP synthase assembly protein I